MSLLMIVVVVSKMSARTRRYGETSRHPKDGGGLRQGGRSCNPICWRRTKCLEFRIPAAQLHLHNSDTLALGLGYSLSSCHGIA